MKRCVVGMLLLALAALGCGSDGTAEDTGAVDPGGPDIMEDLVADVAADAVGDAPGEPGAETMEEVVEPEFPARSLPFEFTRPDEGEPISPEEVTAFTKKVTGLWKKIDWARWILRTSEGVDVSTGTDDFLGWYNDVHATKDGDTVTFAVVGGEHNMWIASSKVLAEAINGYLLTGDWTWGKLTEQYCKGLTAVVKGFVWDENDPAPYLMARAIFPHDNAFTLDAGTWKDDGRKKVVTFEGSKKEEWNWNAQTFAWPHNPTWGDIWITNMRSKDDVRAIVLTTMFLPYVIADAMDDFVREACQETMDTMVGFNKDIVDHDYYIRTKGTDGVAHKIPCSDQDLGSYNCYTDIDPTNECCQRLATDLIAYGEQRTEDCGNCIGSMYDAFASSAHFYNVPIIWDYHMAAVGNALVYGKNDMALMLLDGLKQRIDRYMHPEVDDPEPKSGSWFRELSALLVQTASVGLPLTWLEARQVHKQWTQAVVEFQDFPNWDPWADSVPDGPVQFRPHASGDSIDIEAITLFMQYCNSPFRNPAGVPFVDCDVVADPTQWGE